MSLPIMAKQLAALEVFIMKLRRQEWYGGLTTIVKEIAEVIPNAVLSSLSRAT
ncbi:MAG: hypothetical protein P4L87_09305 [Formivibrio sp.]|nr:hypothetical protein [Formivibrio sp.]